MATNTLARAMKKLAGYARVLGTESAPPRCLSLQARSEQELRFAASRLATGSALGSGTLQILLRELVELNSPALFLNIRQKRGPTHVVLEPWGGASTRFQGSSFLLEAGSAAPEGVEAFALAPFSHVTQLFPTAPDHPVYVMSIEHPAQHVITGLVPSYLTHVSILVNGSLVAHCERLLHERGPHIWAAA